MPYLRRLSILLFLVLSCLPLWSQDEAEEAPIDLLLERLDKHQRLQPQEKLYLHLEKEQYQRGEHLWFKIYLVAGAKHRPSPISTGANIELITPEGQVAKKLYVKINRGLGYGDIAIPRDLPKGIYKVKAYTDWMNNFDWDYIPETKVAINQEEVAQTPSSNDCDTYFFAEGGELIIDLKQRIAFENASHSSIKGTITDKDGSTVTEFESGTMGLGMFSLEAMAGQSYFANIEGCNAPIALPKARATGTVMTARKMGTQFLRLDIATSSEEDGTLLHAIIQSRGVVVNQLSVQVNGDRARAIVPLKDLPSGISQISVFNEQLSLLSQRLVFVDGQESITVEASLKADNNKDWYKVEAEIKDKNENPLAGHFSVAVFSEQPGTNPNNIENFFGLQAELPSVKNPSAFFDPETGNANDQMDLLLMTKKWSWITWKDVKLNRITPTNKSLNTYMNDAFITRQQFQADEEAIEGLDANSRRLDDVVVTARREEEVEENTAVRKIYGKGDGGSIDFDKVQINNNERLIDILRGRMAGVNVSGNDHETTINIRGALTGTGESFVRLEALILLNNMPTDVQSILDIPARFVKSIEVYKGSKASLFGLRGAGGAVAIYTRNTAYVDPGARRKKDQDEEVEEKKEYQKPTTFEPRPPKQKTSMLHWSPVLVTDKEGKISFSFKKPEDVTGPIYLRMQGIDRAGVPYSLVKKLE